MNHAIHIFLCSLVCIFLEPGSAEDKSIPGKDFFPLSANIEGVISPVLLKELQEKRPNVTAAIQQIASTTEKAKPTKSPTKTQRKFRTTTTTTPSSSEKQNEFPGFDLARAQQVRQDNQYPFDYQNSFNNFNSFPGFGQGVSRQFGSGFNGFDDRIPFNSPRQLSSLIDGSKTSENIIQGNDRQSGQSGNGNNNGGNRSPYGNPGGLFDYDRYRGGFGGFGYDDRFNGRLNDQGFRNSDDGFGYSNFPQQNNNQFNNYRQDFRGNFPLNTQQNSLRGEQAYNFQGYSGNQGYLGNQGYSGNLPFQGYAPNNGYDIYQQQGFQGGYGGNDYGQRGLNYPGYYPVRPDAPGRGTGNGVNGGNQSPVNSGNSDAEDVGTITASTKKTETVQKLDEKKNAEAKSGEAAAPVDPKGAQLFYYPQLEDYSDVRFRPDGFKQFVVYPSFVGGRHNNDDILG